MLVLKVVLVALLSVLPAASIGGWIAQLAIVLVGCAVWAALGWVFMPFTSHAMNATSLVEAGVVAWLALCGVTANADAPGAVDPAVLFYCGAPLVIGACIGVANARRARLLAAPSS